MSVVRSHWAGEEIVVGKGLNSAGWSGAGELPLDGVGSVLLRNDHRYLYVGIDVVADQQEDPDLGDWFYLIVDDGGDRVITPNRDRIYTPWPVEPFGSRLAKAYFLGGRFFTGVLDPEPGCELRSGFSGSAASPLPHRTWEMRVPLSELGLDLSSRAAPPVLNIGVVISSALPELSYESAPSVLFDFSDLDQIVLATRPGSIYPPGLAGAVIGGVGLIPATEISTAGDERGRATTVAGYGPRVIDAAFGGVLNVIGNRVTLQYLWGQSARRYRVLHHREGTGGFAPLLQSWTNYRWDGSTYRPEGYGPAADGSYPLLDPSQDYSVDDLLVQWNTTIGFAAGIHHLAVEFLRDDGSVVHAPAQTLVLKLANSGPQVSIDGVGTTAGADVGACATVSVGDALSVRFTARDGEAGLASYVAGARWGTGQSVSLPGATASYRPPPPWDGGSFTADPWSPTEPCAYAIEVTAQSRVTNGYSPQIYSRSASRFITVTRS